MFRTQDHCLVGSNSAIPTPIVPSCRLVLANTNQGFIYLGRSNGDSRRGSLHYQLLTTPPPMIAASTLRLFSEEELHRCSRRISTRKASGTGQQFGMAAT
jgi:hypothetical protein